MSSIGPFALGKSLVALKKCVLPVVGIAITAGLLTGCGADSSDSASAVGTNQLDAQITDTGCTPDKLAVPAGPTTFNITNTGTGKESEYYVMNGKAIVGEVENVTPGIKRTLSLNLKAGTYSLECPAGDSHPKGTLTVTPSNAPAPTASEEATQAVTNYRNYVDVQLAALTNGTKAFTDAVIAGDVAKAKSLYAGARLPYERIEPVAESFGDLDPAIDGRADDTPVEKITGFHRIEYQLWVKNNTDEMKPIAEQLMKDVETLKSKSETLEFDAAKIANGANELLSEVSKSKVTGEEERYSHTDLWDFAANVEGSRAAVAAVRGILDQKDPALGNTIDERFVAVDTALAPYKRGDGWFTYDILVPDDTKQLAQSIDSLAEVVSQVGAKVVTA